MSEKIPLIYDRKTIKERFNLFGKLTYFQGFTIYLLEGWSQNLKFGKLINSFKEPKGHNPWD